MIFEYPLTILERHLDMLGHVNNATYLEIFEEARWDFIEKRGHGLKHIMSVQQGPVILDVTLKFMKELRLREKIAVKSQTLSYEGKIGKVRQWMEGPNGEIHAEAIFTIAFFDLKARKIIPPSPAWAQAVGLSE